MFGYDLLARALKVPIGQNNSFDLMGYCDRNWISDYTYEGVRNFRYAAARPGQASVQSTLMVWGRVGSEGLVLEPAFQLRTRPTGATSGGGYVAEGFDQSGGLLFTTAFDPERIADHRPNDRVFAVAVPLSEDKASRVATIRVRGNGDEAVVRSSGAAAPARVGMGMRDPALTLESEGGKLELRWDRAAHPMILVRDASSSEIIAIARGGRALLARLDGAVDLVMSDGARSVSRRLNPVAD